MEKGRGKAGRLAKLCSVGYPTLGVCERGIIERKEMEKRKERDGQIVSFKLHSTVLRCSFTSAREIRWSCVLNVLMTANDELMT